MKKILLILGIGWLFSGYGTAQTKNVDIDNVWFTYSYRALPTQPRDPVYFRYAVRIQAGKIARSNILAGAVADALFITGQVKTGMAEEAQMLLEITLGDILLKSSDIKERKQEVKDKEGKVTTNYFYKVEVNYSFESSYRILAGEETLSKGTPFVRAFNIQYVSEEYGTRKGATDYWNNNKAVLVAGFYQTHALKTAHDASAFASSHFGFPAIKNARQVIKNMDEKKHNENIAFRAAVASLRDALQDMTPEQAMDRTKVDELADYFKRIPEKYADPNHKADVRLRYAAYFNLCTIYFFADEPE
ncbi:MAG: hypothetical protein LBT83_10845, partial [Tannerella sp.]|nr:hypothetical protein [Tannerella sp.]